MTRPALANWRPLVLHLRGARKRNPSHCVPSPIESSRNCFTPRAERERETVPVLRMMLVGENFHRQQPLLLHFFFRIPKHSAGFYCHESKAFCMHLGKPTRSGRKDSGLRSSPPLTSVSLCFQVNSSEFDANIHSRVMSIWFYSICVQASLRVVEGLDNGEKLLICNNLRQ